jgi:SAP domain
MGAACQSCGGMGVLEDGSDCPECVGGQVVEHEPALVGATVLPASNVSELPPSQATPSGVLGAAATGQGGFIPAEAVKVPATVEIVAEATPIGGNGNGEEEADYESMTNADLQAELESRGLATSGTKAELIARLEEDDAAA